MTSTNLHSTSQPPGFDRWALPAHVAEAVWLGDDIACVSGRTLPTGFEDLDAALPGRGWPTQGLSELLLAQAALCEWRLLAPAFPRFLGEKSSCLYLVAPPKTPHAMGLAQLGLPPDQLVWIEAKGPAERLWATEQLLKSEPSGAVIAWLPQARQEQIRRLQVHAHHCDSPVFLIRPEASLREASPAPLRVSVALGTNWNLDVSIRKRRGAASTEVMHLNAIPSNLNSIITPRLREMRGPEMIQEVFHGLNSSDNSLAVRRHVPH